MAQPTTKAEFKEWCLRKLGKPVIEINVDADQLDDRVDEALEKYQEFHYDATERTFYKHQITALDIENGYVRIPESIIFVKKIFALSSNFSSSRNFFDIKYQMMLNDITDMQNYIGDIAYFEQIKQYLSLLDMKLNGLPQVTFTRRRNRLYIHGDFADGDLKAGEYIILEVQQIIDPDAYTTIYNDMWLKNYATALIKRQWGSNLMKFEGMQLPGGVTLNGRQIFDDANAEIEKLEEELRSTFEETVDFFVG